MNDLYGSLFDQLAVTSSPASATTECNATNKATSFGLTVSTQKIHTHKKRERLDILDTDSLSLLYVSVGGTWLSIKIEMYIHLLYRIDEVQFL